MKKHKNKIIVGVVAAIVLTSIFLYGGDAPGLRGWTIQSKEAINIEKKNTTVQNVTKEEIDGDENEIDEFASSKNKPQSIDQSAVMGNDKGNLTGKSFEDSSVNVQSASKEFSKSNGQLINEATVKDKYKTEPVPSGKPLPNEPQDAVISGKEYTCTLSVRCDTILKNIAWLDSEKIDFVPKDGVIFAEKTVTFYEGESVFNLLLREMKQNKIHMEFENTPIYNSAYIEGVANLYEHDCGELSGWIYKVNDWFPNYGCSRYQLKQGDKVEWVYTCDSGADVGGDYVAKGE